MPFVDTSTLKAIERKPGWFGRYFHSPNMTFAHYEFIRALRFTSTIIRRKKKCGR